MNFKKILATAVSAVVLTTGMAIAAFADSTLTLTSSRDAVVRGESFTISLPITAATKNVGSADIELTYNAKAFTCESTATTDFGDVVFNPKFAESDPVNTAKFSINDIYGAKNTGKLFTVTFKVNADAVGNDYTFSVTTAKIRDVDGTDIDTFTVTPASVTVTAPQQLATPAVTIDEAKKTASWANVTNAADYNVVLQKDGVELYNNNQAAVTFDFAKFVTETGTYKVIVTANQNGSLYLASNPGEASHEYIVNAVLSITKKDYVTGSNGFDVVITPNGNTFEEIVGLTNGTEYTVNDNVVHIEESYLATLAAETTLTFKFDKGTNPTLTVNVTKAADGATLILAERVVTDKYFDDSNNDFDIKANDGSEEGLIVVAAPTAPVTNFLGVQFTISNNADVGYDAVDYEIVPADGFALLYDEATGLYEINVKPVDGVRPAVSEAAAGKGIVIGKLVYNGGYGKGTISAENVMLTVEKSDNTYDHLDVDTVFSFKYDIPEPSKNLTVVVDLSKHYAKVDNVKAYQNMKLRVYSARLGFIDFDLGTDSVAYSEKNGTLETTGAVAYDTAKKTYTLTLENLPAFDKYTVFVSGDGYRDAKVQFDLNEDTTVNFWNNANDSAIAEISKKTSGIVKTAKKNFLAGDIIMNGVIDIYDLSAVSSYYGKSNLTAGDKDFIQYDLNRDGKVNLDDISILLAGWAE
mgnify:FL=1